MSSARSLAPHMQLLLGALREPGTCFALDATQWDLLVRAARAARLLGVLATRVGQTGHSAALPASVADHLQAALAEARYCRQMVLRQLAAIEPIFAPLQTRAVALKGAAYILRELPSAVGRLPRDVDLMVPRARLDDAEQSLLAAGWNYEKNDPYDQHYYRAWTHELPPMRAPAMPLELDLHHNILPPIGRMRADAKALFAAARPVDGSCWWTLSDIDLVLHAAVHLFQDSDCVGSLRDLVDIDSLVRSGLAADPAFVEQLCQRAGELGLGTALWYALDVAAQWLGTPVDAEAPVVAALAPGWPGRALVSRLSRRCLAVVDPEGEPARLDRLAYGAMEFRALWLRMPPWVLAYHSASKLLRRKKPAADSAAG